jgi:hypothetical protein
VEAEASSGQVVVAVCDGASSAGAKMISVCEQIVSNFSLSIDESGEGGLAGSAAFQKVSYL